MNTQQSSRPVITPAMREQATKQPNSWLYVVDPIFTDPNVEVPPWGFIGGYRVDERGELTDDFSPNPHYRPSPVALRLPAPANDLERALQLTTTGYAQGQTLLAALLESELILFAQPQGNGLFTLEHESGRRQLQVFTSDAYLPQNWTTWQRMTGRALAGQQQLTGMDVQVNPTSPVKARVPGEDLVKAAGMVPPKAPIAPAPATPSPAVTSAPAGGTATAQSGSSQSAGAQSVDTQSVDTESTSAQSAAPQPAASQTGPDPSSTAQATPSPLPTTQTAASATAQAESAQSTAAPAAKQEGTRPSLARTSIQPAENSAFNQRFLGAVLAGAIGDALGATVEFYPVDQIRSRYGEQGVTEYDHSGEHPGEFTDDTQLTLFTLEGLIRGHITTRKHGAGSPLPAIQLAYQRWLHTQGYAWTRAVGPFAEKHPEPSGWLIEQRDLFAVRSPDSTCITAFREFASAGVPGTFEHAINGSASCGGVVRAAPVALWSDEPKEVFELAAAVAAMTCSKPNAYLPAGVQAVLVHRLLREESLEQALRTARSLLTGYAGHEPVDQALQAAVDLAAKGKPTPEQLKDTLGSGWTGQEALAIAVCSALSTDTVAAAVMAAVNHSGDSDSTGSICGALVGALHGSTSLPGVWLRDLKQRDMIETLTKDALVEFGEQSPDEGTWSRKYPAEHDTSDLVFTSALPLADSAERTAEETEKPESAAEMGQSPKAESQPDESARTRLKPVAFPAYGAAAEAPAAKADGDAGIVQSPSSTTSSEPAATSEAPSTTETPATTETPEQVPEPSPRPQTLRLSETAATGASDDRSGRILGVLLGGAAGDALGYPIEFDGLDTIRRKYGQQGVTDFVDAYRPGGSISDDTQMTLFTLEGLIRASIRRRLHGETEPGTQVQHAYQRWLHTQGVDWKDAGGPLAETSPDGWLIRQKDLFVRRAPGATCIQALHGYGSGERAGSFTHRLNDSKGCGGVMRAAPAGLWSDDPAEVFRVGAMTAVLTHGHSSGFLPAGVLAVLVQQLLRNRSLPEAVDRALTELSRWDGHEETTSSLRKAIELASEGPPTPEQINEQLGQGWVGEQALAIAVCTALTHPESFSDAVLLAANHTGDSDSTAAICGNIMGAACTASAIPRKWSTKVELHEVIEQLAQDAVQEFGPTPPAEPEWLERYPAETGIPTSPEQESTVDEESIAAAPAQETAGAAPWPIGDPAERVEAVDATSEPDTKTQDQADAGTAMVSAVAESAAPESDAESDSEPDANSPDAQTATTRLAEWPSAGHDTPVADSEDATSDVAAAAVSAESQVSVESAVSVAAPTPVTDTEPADEVPEQDALDSEPSGDSPEAAAPADFVLAADLDEAAESDGAAELNAAEEPATTQAAAEAAPADAEPEVTVPTAATPGEADERLSDEELQMLTAWRKFRDGDEAAPADLSQGLHKLLVEAFGADRAAQLVSEAQEQPQETGQLADEAPLRLGRSDRLAGCVLGGAVGDALAAPWMFTGLDAIMRSNPDGIREYAEFFGRRGSASSPAQQTVFVLEGLLRATIHTRLRETRAHPPTMVHATLQHWLCAQGARFEPTLPTGVLASSDVLRSQRFPDEASLTALATTGAEVPTPSTPPNAARTSAATVRAAAIGLHTEVPGSAVLLGAEIAALTHGHPDGYLPAGALAGMITAVHNGQTLAESVETVLTELELLEGCEATTQGLRSAVDFAKNGSVSPTALEKLGHGWEAPSALAIAVTAALARPDSFSGGVSLAATHSGNSAATAAICGNLLGAARGAEAIPQEWLQELELREVVDDLLADERRIDAELGTDRPAPGWADRYLG